MPPAAAVIGGSIVTGALGARSARKAGEAQASAAERGAGLNVAEQRRQFDITQEQFAPFREAGVGALGAQEALLGLSGAEAQQAAFAGLQDSPGQKFLRERAQRNLLRNAAAIGGLGGGNVRSALVEQGVGFAQQDLQNKFSRLGQIAGQGQAATTALGQFGQQTAAGIGAAQQAGALGAGQARASGILGQNQAVQQGLGGVFTGLGQSGLLTPPPTRGLA